MFMFNYIFNNKDNKNKKNNSSFKNGKFNFTQFLENLSTSKLFIGLMMIFFIFIVLIIKYIIKQQYLLY